MPESGLSFQPAENVGSRPARGRRSSPWLSIQHLLLALHLLVRGRSRCLLEAWEREAGARLREAVFAHELQWVRPSESGLEQDRYDHNAMHFGVFLGGTMVAYGRLLLSSGPFMLEHDFRHMIEGIALVKDGSTAEISRVAIAPALRKTVAGMVVKALLWFAMIRWCLQNGVHAWYVVTSQSIFKQLASMYVCEQVGRSWQFEDGPPIVAALVELDASFEKLARLHPWQALLFRPLFRERARRGVASTRTGETAPGENRQAS